VASKAKFFEQARLFEQGGNREGRVDALDLYARTS
jgi:hypothetical protein